MRIVLAVDASPDSWQAAEMVKQFAEPPVVDVLNVVDEEALQHAYISPEMPASYLDAYRKEVAASAERVLHEAKALLGESCAHIRLIADSGDAAESILQSAHEAKADVIIVGQRGMTATPTFLLGGVSQKVATYAHCSVVVVKQSPAALRRILLAVDGSEASEKVVGFMAREPFKRPVDVHVVTVWPKQRAEFSMFSDLAAVQSLVKTKGEEMLNGIASRLRPHGDAIETELLQGDPAVAILDAAVRHRAQLIVIGSRGLKAIKRFLLGSVSQKVLVYSECSVLIVR